MLLWKDGDAPEMMMAKQNFGLPYLQRLMARKAGKQQEEEVCSVHVWGQEGRKETNGKRGPREESFGLWGTGNSPLVCYMRGRWCWAEPFETTEERRREKS